MCPASAPLPLEISTWASTSVTLTLPSRARRVAPALVCTNAPVPPDTVYVEFTLELHPPPVVAVPHPAATVRSKSSAAIGAGGPPGEVTVTGWLIVPVAPAASVTVRVTVWLPAAAYAWVAVAPRPAGVPSPKFHE